VVNYIHLDIEYKMLNLIFSTSKRPRDDAVVFRAILRDENLQKLAPKSCLISTDAFQRLPADVCLQEAPRDYLLAVSVTVFSIVGLLGPSSDRQSIE